MKKVLFLVLMVALVGCGKDGSIGPRGAAGPGGADGADGDDGSAYETTFDVYASRDYDPSSWNNEDFDVEPGVYALPDKLDLVAGVAGTGWATIKLGSYLYCYQGNGISNAHAGTAFEYSHAEDSDTGNCGNGTSGKIEGINKNFVGVVYDSTLTVEVNGGGVSSAIRTYTEVEAEVEGFIY